MADKLSHFEWDDFQIVEWMFIVLRIKWKEGDICKIFWENLIKGGVYKERVCAFYL